MLAFATELEVPAHGRLSGRIRFVEACRFCLAALIGNILLPEAVGLDLFFVRLDDVYTLRRCLVLMIKDTPPRFSANFFCQRRGVCNVSQLVMEDIYAHPSISVHFRNIPKRAQYLWRSLATFERRAFDELWYLVPYECAKVYFPTDFARANRYIPLSLTRSSIEVPMKCAALLPSCASYLGSRHQDDPNSGLWMPVYAGSAELCSHHLFWDVYQYQQLWYFLHVLRAMIKTIDSSVFVESQFHADELQNLVFVIETID